MATDRRLTLNKGPRLQELTSRYEEAGQKPNSFVAMSIEKWLEFETMGLNQDMADWLVNTPQLITFLAALKQASAQGGYIEQATQIHLRNMINDIVGAAASNVEPSNSAIDIQSTDSVLQKSDVPVQPIKQAIGTTSNRPTSTPPPQKIKPPASF